MVGAPQPKDILGEASSVQYQVPGTFSGDDKGSALLMKPFPLSGYPMQIRYRIIEFTGCLV